MYRAFTATDRDPMYQPGEDAEDRQALLRGLFVTGFLAEDFFADNDWFGARRVVVLSASSKTAIGFAHCAASRGGIDVIGLTSHANLPFVRHVGCYDEALGYDEIPSIPADAATVSIDMSGNGEVLARVHRHFGGQLKHSMAIGRSHHDSPPAAKDLDGPRPAFFFAPTQVKKRLQDWGGGYVAHGARRTRGPIRGLRGIAREIGDIPLFPKANRGMSPISRAASRQRRPS